MARGMARGMERDVETPPRLMRWGGLLSVMHARVWTVCVICVGM